MFPLHIVSHNEKTAEQFTLCLTPNTQFFRRVPTTVPHPPVGAMHTSPVCHNPLKANIKCRNEPWRV